MESGGSVSVRMRNLRFDVRSLRSLIKGAVQKPTLNSPNFHRDMYIHS